MPARASGKQREKPRQVLPAAAQLALEAQAQFGFAGEALVANASAGLWRSFSRLLTLASPQHITTQLLLLVLKERADYPEVRIVRGRQRGAMTRIGITLADRAWVGI